MNLSRLAHSDELPYEYVVKLIRMGLVCASIELRAREQ